ncbi:MAG: hypothetical protein LBG65_03965, partial [Puniceicoccales bacterium]|nr:hypothetical protein [Puniceicoccales bacterium]
MKASSAGMARWPGNSRDNFRVLFENHGVAELQRAARWLLLRLSSFGGKSGTCGRGRDSFTGYDPTVRIPLIRRLRPPLALAPQTSREACAASLRLPRSQLSQPFSFRPFNPFQPLPVDVSADYEAHISAVIEVTRPLPDGTHRTFWKPVAPRFDLCMCECYQILLS